MRRQLYRGGGITGLYPRKKFGLGSKWQDLNDKAVETVTKIIPNELADVAVKAAPFVAMIPGQQGTAALMRGLGRLDQRGDLTDALKQGALTYGFGRYVAPTIRQGVGNLYEGAQAKLGAWGGPKTPLKSVPYQNVHQTGAVTQTPANIIAKTSSAATDPSGQKWWHKALFGEKGGEGFFGEKGLIGAKGAFDMKGAIGKGLPAVFAGSTLASLAVQKAMGDVGGREPGESLEAFNKRRKGTVSQYLDYYFRRANKFRIAPENMDAAAAKFVADNTKEYVSHGGRVGLYGGGEAGIKSLEAGAPDITYEGNEGPQAPMKMAEFDLKEWIWESNRQSFSNSMFGKDYEDLTLDQQETIDIQLQMELGKKGPVIPSPEDPINPFAPKPQGPVLPDKMMAAKGGRIKYNLGTDPRALMGAPGLAGMQSSPRSTMDPRGLRGLPGIPRQAPDGMEFDMRENGGFQGLGAKEGKDDVKALLAKNEFVMTADAVRGAGGGDIELGAQRMYDTMKNLEKRVV